MGILIRSIIDGQRQRSRKRVRISEDNDRGSQGQPLPVPLPAHNTRRPYQRVSASQMAPQPLANVSAPLRRRNARRWERSEIPVLNIPGSGHISSRVDYSLPAQPDDDLTFRQNIQNWEQRANELRRAIGGDSDMSFDFTNYTPRQGNDYTSQRLRYEVRRRSNTQVRRLRQRMARIPHANDVNSMEGLMDLRDTNDGEDSPLGQEERGTSFEDDESNEGEHYFNIVDLDGERVSSSNIRSGYRDGMSSQAQHSATNVPQPRRTGFYRHENSRLDEPTEGRLSNRVRNRNSFVVSGEGDSFEIWTVLNSNASEDDEGEASNNG